MKKHLAAVLLSAIPLVLSAETPQERQAPRQYTMAPALRVDDRGDLVPAVEAAPARAMSSPKPLVGCVEVEPNESPNNATPVQLGTPCTGSAAFADAYVYQVADNPKGAQRIVDFWSVTLAQSSTVDVTLTFTNGASDVDIYLFPFSISGSSSLGNSVGTGTTEHFTTGALAPATYLIAIAVSSGSSTPYTLTMNATPVGGTAPAAPSNLTPTITGAASVRLNWQDNSNNETEFRIEAKTIGGFVDQGGVGPNITTVEFTNVAAGTYTFRVKARNGSGDSGYTNEVTVTLGASGGSCVPSATVLCLQGNRFKLEGTYLLQDNQGSGPLTFTKVTDASGYWVHKDPTDVQAVVKVLNQCGISNNNYWVFVGALTNQQVHLVVTDTKTNTVKVYDNALFHVFTPIQDTHAFATCP